MKTKLLAEPNHIKRVYVRTYSDSGQVTVYVEWASGARTEGPQDNVHIQQLLARADREGVEFEREIW
jgi:hypothetical protein